jgi:hypothetical protein
MSALATMLLRVRSAKNRLPRLNGRGRPADSLNVNHPRSTTSWLERLLELNELARRIAPTVVVIALRIFR